MPNEPPAPRGKNISRPQGSLLRKRLAAIHTRLTPSATSPPRFDAINLPCDNRSVPSRPFPASLFSRQPTSSLTPPSNRAFPRLPVLGALTPPPGPLPATQSGARADSRSSSRAVIGMSSPQIGSGAARRHRYGTSEKTSPAKRAQVMTTKTEAWEKQHAASWPGFGSVARNLVHYWILQERSPPRIGASVRYNWLRGVVSRAARSCLPCLLERRKDGCYSGSYEGV